MSVHELVFLELDSGSPRVLDGVLNLTVTPVGGAEL